MISPVFYAALALVAADLSGDFAAVSSQASGLNAAVTGWSSGDGLSGALVIQQSYDPLSSAVGALADSVKGVSYDDVVANADGVTGLSSTVTTLLNSLVEKAADFESVQATSIVKGDIDGLSGTSAQIVSDLAAAAGDSGIPKELADAGNSISAAFGSAISAFGGKSVEFPSLSAGSGSGDSSSSADSSESSAESTAAESSAAESSSVAEHTSASSDVAAANGAAVIGGASALVAGAVALLL